MTHTHERTHARARARTHTRTPARARARPSARPPARTHARARARALLLLQPRPMAACSMLPTVMASSLGVVHLRGKHARTGCWCEAHAQRGTPPLCFGMAEPCARGLRREARAVRPRSSRSKQAQMRCLLLCVCVPWRRSLCARAMAVRIRVRVRAVQALRRSLHLLWPTLVATTDDASYRVTALPRLCLLWRPLRTMAHSTYYGALDHEEVLLWRVEQHVGRHAARKRRQQHDGRVHLE